MSEVNKIANYNQMMSWLTRPSKPKTQVASAETDALKEQFNEKLGPGVIKTLDELPPVQDPFKDFEDRNPRETAAQGGVIGKDGMFPGQDMGTREGFSKLYGKNIRLSTTGADTFEVQVVRGGTAGGKKGEGQRFYKNFKFDDYGGKEAALKAAEEYRDSVKNIPKKTGTVITDKVLEAQEKRKGKVSETGKQAEIRNILNKFIEEGKTSFSNEDVRELIDEDLFDTDKNFRTAVDTVKKENAFKNLNFIEKQRDRADYFTDPSIRNTLKENYKKLKSGNLAKLVFPDEPLTTSRARVETILSDMADKGEIVRLKSGEFSEERKSDFDPSPKAEKIAKVSKNRRNKIDVLGSKDYEKELYKFKKEIQAGLGLEKIESSGKISGKSTLFDPIDMGHQSSITQLKGLKQKLKPEDLNPQFYRANREGITKYEGGVKTLENNLQKNFYPEQKKLYKQAQKFINAGQEIPADLQNKIITSNEDIQKFINKTVEQYPLLKNRVNAITIDANDLTVRRGGNVFTQLGIGLVDQNLGDIEIGGIDDLTIKANLAEQTLREAIDSGLIDEKVGREKLDIFLKAQPIQLEELSNVQKVIRKMQGQMNSGMDPKLLVEYLGAEVKDLAAFGSKYGGDALSKVGKGVAGIDLPIFQTMFGSMYDIEQDSPLWLTIPAAFTDEVSNMFNLYNKSEGRFGLGKAKDFGKFVASSFVPRVMRSPLFKAASKVGKAGSFAAPVLELGKQAYLSEKRKGMLPDIARQFDIPIEEARRGYDNYVKQGQIRGMQSMVDDTEIPEISKQGKDNLNSNINAFKQLGAMLGLNEDPYAEKESIYTRGKENPMSLDRALYPNRQNFADGPEDPSKKGLGSLTKRNFLKILSLIPAGILAVRGGPNLLKKTEKATEIIKRGADGIPDFLADLIAKVKLKAETTGMKYFTGKSSDEFADVYQADDFVVTEQGNKITIKKRNEDGEMIEKDMEIELEKDPETGGVTYKEATARPDGEGKLKDVDEYIDDIDLEDMRRYTYDE